MQIAQQVQGTFWRGGGGGGGGGERERGRHSTVRPYMKTKRGFLRPYRPELHVNMHSLKGD